MSGADRERISSELQNVEIVHREHPRTFSIPRSDQRRSLRPGQLVKLIFRIDTPVEDEPGAERMWVEVQEVSGERYVGTLENQPRYITNLRSGDRVAFGPEHVAALYRRESEPQLPYNKNAKVSFRVYLEGAWPQRLVHLASDDEDFSGWWILSAQESEISDVASYITGPVEEMMTRFRILDSVLDEPPGTAWSWNEQAAEYERDPP